MTKRSKLGALIGAGLLTFALGSTALASQTYSIDVTKTADPPTVPIGGGDVTFTVSVHNTGSGAFNEVLVTDPLAGCSLTGDHPSGPSDHLNADETWTWSCTVHVDPGTENTASVDACHNAAACADEGVQHVTKDSNTVTVGLGAATTPAITQEPTDTEFGTAGTSGPSDGAWLLVVALGVLLGSIVVLAPARAKSRR